MSTGYQAPYANPGSGGFITNLSGIKLWLYWGVGAIALIALAGAQPQVAIFLAVILIAGVLLIHWNDTYAAFFSHFGFVAPGGK